MCGAEETRKRDKRVLKFVKGQEDFGSLITHPGPGQSGKARRAGAAAVGIRKYVWKKRHMRMALVLWRAGRRGDQLWGTHIPHWALPSLEGATADRLTHSGH